MSFKGVFDEFDEFGVCVFLVGLLSLEMRLVSLERGEVGVGGGRWGTRGEVWQRGGDMHVSLGIMSEDMLVVASRFVLS